MHRLTCYVVGFVACVSLVGSAIAAGASEATVQGIYEGSVKDGQGTRKLEARVVACGKATYKVYVRVAAGKDKVDKIELDGKTDGEAVRFEGGSGDGKWSASYADGAIEGKSAGGAALKMKRTVRKSPSLGVKPPVGAIVLLDGKNFDEMTKRPLKNGTEQEWKLVDGDGIQVPRGGMNSKRRFGGSFKFHVEFKNPLMPGARGQGRGNSGVYLPNGDEIQVLDSFGMDTYTGGCCGGIYKYKDPDTFDKFSLASLPPLQWQTYDIEYRVKTKDGKPAGKPRVTVLHNGIKIHDNFQLHRDARKGGLHFQDHGNPVHYRNMWVLPLEEK